VTLDEFIKDGVERITQSNLASRAHIKEPNFAGLYVRLTRRYIDGAAYRPVLDIADVNVREACRGRGVFTAFLDRVRDRYPTLHLFVENVMEERFQKHLERYGFTVVEPRLDPPCYFLPATKEP
jgi:hypothetical protein